MNRTFAIQSEEKLKEKTLNYSDKFHARILIKKQEVYFCIMNSAIYQQITDCDKAFIDQHRHDDVKALALSLAKNQKINREIVLIQISGRQAVEKKIPSWHACDQIFYPPHLSLEQCSSELTAQYKTTLCSGESLTDLTGGFGVDFAFMASQFQSCCYVEQQELLCFVARHNFNALGIHHSTVVNSSTVDYLQTMQPQSWVYIDPARRNAAGSKTVLLKDCQPDITTIYNDILLKCNALMVKLSPMLDISLALQGMPQTTKIHVVAVNNECKELLFISDTDKASHPEIRCINLSENKPTQIFSFNREDEQNAPCQYAQCVENYLYEPNSAILKAGAFKLMSARFGLKKLHPDSHLYTSAQKVNSFPGRTFLVDTTFSAGKNEIKQLQATTTQANIAIRNYPGSVDELRKRLRIKEGGEIYLFATTLFTGEKAIIKCRKSH